jgi:hypothetical protein
MSMQHRLSDKVVVHADPWTFYCAVCSNQQVTVTRRALEAIDQAPSISERYR